MLPILFLKHETGNMTKLKLPLHCYDEAGRITPSVWFMLVLFWGARAILVLGSAIILGENGEAITSMIFPLAYYFKLHLALGVGYLSLWLVTGRREWFWKNGYSLHWIKALLFFLVMIDIGLQCVALADSIRKFNAIAEGMVLITFFALMYLMNSKRTRLMFKDWRA